MYFKTLEPAFFDTDALGHVNNTRLPAWFEWARNDLFRVFVPDLDPRKWPLIMARIEVDFLAELQYGHEVEIRTWLSRLGGSSFTVTQEVWQHGMCGARGQCVLVQFDHQNKQSLRIEGVLRETLTSHLHEHTDSRELDVTALREAAQAGATHGSVPA
ncbi:acyl-CoA thioesterase [Cobetia crustatorum]|uniref:acyl-CoA thioesterase n=1 Tax=Cobetia crustatorum TaxID=553385 RepID=UPI000467EFFE